MKLINVKEIDVKKSKFIGYYYYIDELNEVSIILSSLKKENKKARHMPYAYKIDNNVKKCDDKEPSGTAGLPILNIIEKNDLNNILIVVIRYFGGIKLGTGGLIRAYANCAKETIKSEIL